MTVQPIEPTLFASLDPPRLTGGRCVGCATVVFPRLPGCPRCEESSEPITLPTSGTVWSWTRQHIAPKPPYRAPEAGFTPFALGYVDLGPVRVEALLVPADHDWHIGAAVDLVLTGTGVHDGGAELLTYAFTPVTGPTVDTTPAGATEGPRR